ncbi:MAG: TolC family protein [Gammaproteobacteria bacterium]
MNRRIKQSYNNKKVINNPGCWLAIYQKIMNTKAISICLISFLTSCAEYQTYTPSPVDTEQTTREYRALDIDALEIKNWLIENGESVTAWPRQSWNIESLVLIGNYFSADLAIAKAEVDVAKAAEITAGQKPNPQIEIFSERHSQNQNAVSAWTVGPIFSWIYQRPEKRQARINYAKAMTEVAHLKQFIIKWKIRDTITDHYLDVVAANQKKAMLLEEKKVLQEGMEVLEQRLSYGQASDFEISSSRLELQRLRLLISETEAEQARSKSRLALAIRLPADALNIVDLNTDIYKQLPVIDIYDLNLEVLQARALIERPDILITLSNYVVAEADLHREIENQYSDITFTPGFRFDQNDNVWVLASSWMLPWNSINEGPIAEAEARRKVKEQQVLAHQGEILGQVHNARIRYETSLNTLKEADSIISELTDRGTKLQRQYDLGYSDRLSIIRNQLEILLAKRARYILELASWRELNNLEDSLMSKLN